MRIVCGVWQCRRDSLAQTASLPFPCLLELSNAGASQPRVLEVYVFIFIYFFIIHICPMHLYKMCIYVNV